VHYCTFPPSEPDRRVRPASGSSTDKARPAPDRSLTTLTILIGGRRPFGWKVRKLVLPPLSTAFLPQSVVPTVSSFSTHREVCPVSREAMSFQKKTQLLSSPLQTGLRFLPCRLPAGPSAFLTVGFPQKKLLRSTTGLPRSDRFDRNGEGAVYTPVVQHLRQGISESLFLTTYLLVQACQSLWLVSSHDACNSSLPFTFPFHPSSQPP
jgi:hypothetical protein